MTELLEPVPRSCSAPQLDAGMPAVEKHADGEMPSMRCDAESDEAPRCRVCFEPGTFEDQKEDGELIEPCACKGTQRYVHKSCLVRWQQVTQAQPNSRRAFICSVCTEPFSICPPPVAPGRHS
jgi:hypothetical protein